MNPLFPRASRALQEAALSEFRASNLARLVGQLHRARRGGDRNRLIRTLQNVTSEGRRVERYAKSGFLSGVAREVAGVLLRELGPLGGLLKALSGIGGGGGSPPRVTAPAGGSGNFDREIQTAIKFLEAFGYTVTPPGQPAPGGRTPAPPRAPRRDRDPLEELGFVPQRTPERRDLVTPPSRAPFPMGRPAERVNIGGISRKYDPADPVFSGEMVEVQSSNVHSIGFNFNASEPTKGTLKVRFLQKKGTGTGPGPLYFYYGVNPAVFDAFMVAASKGKFVWDRLRIRGTVSGHRFHYELKGIVNGYLPRKATRYGPNEYFIGRRLRFTSERTGATREFQSELPDSFVGRAEPQRPNFGIPNRGAPNRGTPNRGRR